MNLNTIQHIWLRWQPLFLVVVLLALITQAYTPAWRGHLQVDVVAYHLRAQHFFEHDYSWAGLRGNEYQPGALWFFVLIGMVTSTISNFEAFLTAIVIVNSLLICGYFYYFKMYGHRYASLLFLLFALAAGPILLYRFELLVVLLTIVSWHFFQHKKLSVASFLLGLATAIKVYPLIILPIFIIQHLQKKKLQDILLIVAWYAAGLAAPVAVFLGFSGGLTGLLSSLEFHQLKPVGFEGVLGMAILIAQNISDIPLRTAPGYGVYGFASSLPLLSNGVLNNIWMVPVGMFYGLWWYYRRSIQLASPAVLFSLLILFTTFTKVLNPQYLWWFVPIMPMMQARWSKNLSIYSTSLIIIALLVFTQVVYPLNYSDFLEVFNRTSFLGQPLFILSAIRNILLLQLVIVGMYFIADGISQGDRK